MGPAPAVAGGVGGAEAYTYPAGAVGLLAGGLRAGRLDGGGAAAGGPSTVASCGLLPSRDCVLYSCISCLYSATCVVYGNNPLWYSSMRY